KVRGARRPPRDLEQLLATGSSYRHIVRKCLRQLPEDRFTRKRPGVDETQYQWVRSGISRRRLHWPLAPLVSPTPGRPLYGGATFIFAHAGLPIGVARA